VRKWPVIHVTRYPHREGLFWSIDVHWTHANTGDTTMSSNMKIGLVALLMLGTATVTQAGSRDDSDHSGGYAVGPLGQIFNAGVASNYGSAAEGFAYAGSRPAGRLPLGGLNTIKSDGKCWVNTTNGNYMWAGCQ
jgi:hypothetical protein